MPEARDEEGCGAGSKAERDDRARLGVEESDGQLCERGDQRPDDRVVNERPQITKRDVERLILSVGIEVRSLVCRLVVDALPNARKNQVLEREQEAPNGEEAREDTAAQGCVDGLQVNQSLRAKEHENSGCGSRDADEPQRLGHCEFLLPGRWHRGLHYLTWTWPAKIA